MNVSVYVCQALSSWDGRRHVNETWRQTTNDDVKRFKDRNTTAAAAAAGLWNVLVTVLLSRRITNRVGLNDEDIDDECFWLTAGVLLLCNVHANDQLTINRRCRCYSRQDRYLLIAVCVSAEYLKMFWSDRIFFKEECLCAREQSISYWTGSGLWSGSWIISQSIAGRV